MNKEKSLFAKEDSLVEVPYVKPSFLGSLDVKSMIPRSHGSWTNDMKNVMCYMQYVMWYVQGVMCYMNYDMFYVYGISCCVQNVKYDACYSHGITFLI